MVTDEDARPFSAALCRGLIEASPSEVSNMERYACFPRLYAAASLKQVAGRNEQGTDRGFSAALCRGLIEARCRPARRRRGRGCFPRLYAAASLKPQIAMAMRPMDFSFPRLYAAASLKPLHRRTHNRGRGAFSAALCRGLIEACRLRPPPCRRNPCFPRLYAAASLKRGGDSRSPTSPTPRFPRLYAAASLKRDGGPGLGGPGQSVFRGFMPRPH